MDGDSPESGKLMRASIGAGICSTILLIVPLAGIFAFIYRFPVAFAGQVSGLDAVVPAMGMAIVCLVLGGFIVVGIIGAIAGAVGQEWNPFGNRWVSIVFFSAIGDAILLFIVGNLN